MSSTLRAFSDGTGGIVLFKLAGNFAAKIVTVCLRVEKVNFSAIINSLSKRLSIHLFKTWYNILPNHIKNQSAVQGNICGCVCRDAKRLSSNLNYGIG